VLVQGLPVQERRRAADTMATEARWRVQDPVYGCTGVIDRLQQEIRAVQHELATTRAQLAVYERAAPPAQGTQLMMMMPSLSPPPPQQPLLVPAAAVTGSAAVRGVAVHDDDNGAPLMDPDEFLDLDGRL